MSKLEDFDIDGLTLVLNNELDFIVAALQQNEAQSNLRIDNVKLKLGQGKESAAPFENSLDANRYPTEEPWEVELQYTIGQSNRSQIASGQENRTEEKLLLENFKNVSLQKLKGIDKIWLKKWSSIGVKNINDLVKIDSEKVIDFSKKEQSIVPLEHHSKALLLLEIVIPNSLEAFKNVSLETFLLNDIQTLKQFFGNKISVAQLSNYQRQARILLLVFDIDFIKKQPITVLS